MNSWKSCQNFKTASSTISPPGKPVAAQVIVWHARDNVAHWSEPQAGQLAALADAKTGIQHSHLKNCEKEKVQCFFLN